jgi:hypothetical protein
MFIDFTWVIQYSQLLFQVNYTKDIFDLKQPGDLFTTLFETYNLASVIQSETKSLKDVKSQILALEEHILKNFTETFTLKDMPTDVYDACHVSKVFTQAGYTLESASNSNGWTPLNEVKELMRLDLCIWTDEVTCS